MQSNKHSMKCMHQWQCHCCTCIVHYSHSALQDVLLLLLLALLVETNQKEISSLWVSLLCLAAWHQLLCTWLGDLCWKCCVDVVRRVNLAMSKSVVVTSHRWQWYAVPLWIFSNTKLHFSSVGLPGRCPKLLVIQQLPSCRFSCW